MTTPVTPNPLASSLHKAILALSATRRQRNTYRDWVRTAVSMAIKERRNAERERRLRLRVDQEYSEFRARLIDPAFDLAAPPRRARPSSEVPVHDWSPNSTDQSEPPRPQA